MNIISGLLEDPMHLVIINNDCVHGVQINPIYISYYIFHSFFFSLGFRFFLVHVINKPHISFIKGNMKSPLEIF